VFSSESDGSLSFEDFLDLYSTFSEQATRDVKTTFAFKIYDFDNDGLVGKLNYHYFFSILYSWKMEGYF
jgi:Ca2+-binding EF-hand superfamily protein